MAGASKKRQREQRRQQNSGATPKNASDQQNSSSRSPSPSGNSPRTPPGAFDGNRDPHAASHGANPASRASEFPVRFRNLDLGTAGSYIQLGEAVPPNLVRRPAVGNSTGRAITVRLNTFNATQIPVKTVYQYDVTVGSGGEKRGLIRNVWNSKTVQNILGNGWIFDGNKIAWFNEDKGPGEKCIEVDLDKEQGRVPRPGKPNKHKIFIKRAANVPFASLNAWMDGQADFNVKCIEAINFLDHLMREGPSRRFTQIKRNFFSRGQTRTILGNGVEAFKGVYASIRPVATGWNRPPVMSINVDVANGTFWTATSMDIVAQALIGARDQAQASQWLKDTKGPSFQQLQKIKKLRFKTTHSSDDKTWVVHRVSSKTARTHTFKTKIGNGPEKEMTVVAYFEQKYGKRLKFPDLPLLDCHQDRSKQLLIPMEFAEIEENQRYPFKLSDRQTMEMIKFAVTLPDQRWAAVQHGLGMLKWGEDQFLAKYGLRVSTAPVQVNARILPNPKVMFGNNKSIDPKTSGRWDLRGQKFLEPNREALKSWGVAIVKGRGQTISRELVITFVKQLITIYKGHGGRIASEQPEVIEVPADGGKAVEELYAKTGNKFNAVPQLLVFVVPDKQIEMYNRIKKSADCRYGVVSQVLQSAHVARCQAQYCSNVCLKINAKLGGCTARAIGIKGNANWFKVPTVVIGADVSHAAPGLRDGQASASIASITVSQDIYAIKYAAGVETNGSRVEMVTKDNFRKVARPLLEKWIKTFSGKFPEHVIYMRDGVSEGQFAKVLQEELVSLRDVMKEMNPKMQTKFTVLVCSKRHHIRFFPERPNGDKNNNPQPGTLVEMGCTHPFDYDFYLCPHSAIKGTARPVHYYVLKDEYKMDHATLHNWLYEASYQYVRSTTPVSLFPAIYYAHIAAGRGGSHINQPAKSPNKEQTAAETQTSGSTEVILPLLPMPERNGITGVMWYI